MKRIAWLLAVVLTLIPSAVLAQEAAREGEPGSAATEPREAPEDGCGSPGDVDLIAQVEELVAPKEGRVGVVVYGHAAVFRLPAEHPCLERWMPLILRSLEFGTLVRLSLGNAGTEITMVTSAPGEEAGWQIDTEEGESPAEDGERAQDGRLLEAVSVTFTEEQLAELEAGEPGLRETLRQVEIRSITYLSDGLRVKGYLLAPKEGEALPAVIFNRGGNREFGAWTDERVARVLAPIASWGYVVVASQYRGNGGGEGREEFGGRDVDDVLNLVPLLEALPRVDPSRIGMVGWSRGGMMTYLALARTDRIAAAVVGAGVADSFDAVADRPELEEFVFSELVPRWAEEREAALEARSAIRWPEKLHKGTPILLLHGTGDWRVSPLQALRMATALFEVEHPFRLVVLEGGDHGLTEHAGEVDRLLRDWLDRYVRDREPWPSLEPHGR